MIESVQIPKENIEEVWPIVVKDIADALARSNGFKIRESGAGTNNSGETYIYMAFAEEPLVANVGASIPATAR